MNKAPQPKELLPNGTRVVFYNQSRMIAKGTITQAYYKVKGDRGTITTIACANATPENQAKPGLFARIWKAIKG
jgi:hypothetical protein